MIMLSVDHAPNRPDVAHPFLTEGMDDGVDLRVRPRNWKQATRPPDAERWEQVRDGEVATM